MKNNIQLLLVVETDDNSKTDFHYIQSVLEYYYTVGENKISFVYMGSKYNYNSNKVTNRINKYIKDYSILSGGKSKVIYFFDKDQSSSNPDDLRFNNEVVEYCNDLNYDIVWFVNDVEDVMLGIDRSSDQKIKMARSFYIRNKIKDVNESNLRAHHNVNSRCKSNILTVLDKFEEIKK